MLAINSTILSLLVIAASILVVVLIILWIALPFAGFGLKTRLDNIFTVQTEIFKQLGGKVITKHGIRHFLTTDEFNKQLREKL